MTHGRHAVTQVVRWLAIYLVVLQAVFAGLAAGAMAGPQTGADPFLLCLSSHTDAASDGTSDDGGTPAAPLHHDCTACPLAGGTPVLPALMQPGLPVAFTQRAQAPNTRTVAAPPLRVCPNARPRAPPVSA